MTALLSATKSVLEDMPTALTMSTALEDRNDMVELESKILNIEIGLDDCIEQVQEIDK